MSPGELNVVRADRPYVLDFPRLFSQYVIKLPHATQPVGSVISLTAARLVRSLARDLLNADTNLMASATKLQLGPCRSCCAAGLGSRGFLAKPPTSMARQ